MAISNQMLYNKDGTLANTAPSMDDYDPETGELKSLSGGGYYAPPMVNGKYVLGTTWDNGIVPWTGAVAKPYSATWQDGVGWVIDPATWKRESDANNAAARAAYAKNNKGDWASAYGPLAFGLGAAGAIAGAAGAAGGASSLGGGLASQSAIDAYLAGGGAASGVFNAAGTGSTTGGSYGGFGGGAGGTMDFPDFSGDVGSDWWNAPDTVKGGGASVGEVKGAGGGGSSWLDELLKPNNLISNGLRLAGGLFGQNAANRAADAQIGATNAATQLERDQYNQTRADQEPWRLAGTGALARISALLAPGGDFSRRFSDADLQADPVYQSGLKFGLDEGTKGVNQRAIAGGGYDSGATLKALTRFANDYGSTKANDSFNRFNTENSNIFGRLASTAGLGQAATNQVQAAGTNFANNASNLATDAGNARAASIVGGTNSLSNAFSGIANSFNPNSSERILQALLGGRTSSYG